METTTTSSGGENNNREARRRRIVDRGADRLALITGRINNLPPPPPPPSHSHTASCPPSISHHHHRTVPSDLSDLPESDLAEGEFTDSSLKQHDDITKVQPVMRKCETSVGASFQSASEITEIPPIPVSSTVENPSIHSSNTRPPQSRPPSPLNSFTPSEINTAVSSSERTRTCCSIVAAILVVLSYIGFPIVGSQFVKSILLFKPLYLLLLTNISIVVSLVLLGKQRGVGKDRKDGGPEESFGMADQVGNALELGFMLQKLLGSFFMDCSIYAIVVICGLSLAHKLGW